MSEPLARALHTETKRVLDVCLDDSGGLIAIPAPTQSGAVFIAALPPSAIPVELAGSWQHFKGRVYEFLACVRSGDSELLLYRDENGGCWLRPLAMISESVERDGKRLPRFERVT